MAERGSTNRGGRGALLTAFVAVIAAAVVAGVAIAAAPTADPRFESRAVLLIDQPLSVASSGDEGVIVKLIRLRVKYSDLLRTDPLATPVSEALGVPIGQVKGNLRTELPFQSLLLVVVGSGSSPEEARALAQAGAESIQSYAAAEQQLDSVPDPQRVTFEIVDQADAGARAGDNRSRRLTVGLLAGGLTLVFVLAVSEASRRWRRKERPEAD